MSEGIKPMRGQRVPQSWIFALAFLLLSCDGQIQKPANPTGDVSGLVRVSGTSSPIEGALVTCAGDTTVADSKGAYDLWEVPGGYQVVRAEKPGYEAHSAGVYVHGHISHNIYMERLPDRGSISGYAYYEGTIQPVPGVIVNCAGKTDTTDAVGAFFIDSVHYGTYAIEAAKNRWVAYRSMVDVDGHVSCHVLMATASVRGSVIHAYDGPIAGARISVEGMVGYSDAGGYFHLEHAPQGIHMITCTHPAYNGSLEEATITGLGVTFDFVLTRTTYDSIPVTEDATVSIAELEGCDDCPSWGAQDRNYGQATKIELAYFMRSDTGSEPATYSAKTRFFIRLPELPDHFDANNITQARLIVKPTGESFIPGRISVRRVKPSAPPWAENSLTWDNAPAVFSVTFATANSLGTARWEIDVLPIYRDPSDDSRSIRVQQEEIGPANPYHFQYFWSSEAPSVENRPLLIYAYTR